MWSSGVHTSRGFFGVAATAAVDVVIVGGIGVAVGLVTFGVVVVVPGRNLGDGGEESDGEHELEIFFLTAW